MEADIQEHVAFYLTGKRPGAALEAVEELDLRPALLAGYHDLTQLRYDFPLVLVENGTSDGAIVRSLSAIVDEVVSEMAQVGDGDRLARHALRIEQSIRAAVAAGSRGSLSALWNEAAENLADEGDVLSQDSLARVRAALTVDGELLDCHEDTPAQFLRHTWSAVEQSKADRASGEIRNLIMKLSDILRVDFERSDAGRSAENLKASVGASHAEMFDFDAMSRFLGRPSSADALPASRRTRIEQLIETLSSQRFFGTPLGGVDASTDKHLYTFVFDNCASALSAYRERLPKIIELARAISMAELEINTQYDEALHDTIYADFGSDGLNSREMARFPNYLVLIDEKRLRGSERDVLIEIMSSGLPMKFLVQTDDILDSSALSIDARLSFGVRSRQLAISAIGLNDVYVLQATSSHLYQFRDRIVDGLNAPGPALFSVFSGASRANHGLSPYLIAAAAMDSRVFPAFVYDPIAGDTWAERFNLEENSQAERDWPVQYFSYEDEDHQRVETNIAFTLADFVACDHRFAKHFARVPQARWNSSMVSVDEYLCHKSNGVTDKVPCTLLTDGKNLLYKVIVDDRLIEATRRCRVAWHSLQELGGIHNSHAERLLARERIQWEELQVQAALNASPPPAVPPGGASVDLAVESVTQVATDDEEPEPSSDEAYVETARCTTCNECIQINDKMFAYDENKQCHIVDLDAGTYRDLVEAAENCQVAIIHPGKPRNPNEPGLEELIKRAESFL